MSSIPRIITLPDFTWDTTLKHTSVRFELLADINMVMFIEQYTRWSESMFEQIRASQYNKYMLYDPSKLSPYLMYYNVNDQQSVRLGNVSIIALRRFSMGRRHTKFWLYDIALDSVTGYILETDAEYS